MKSKIDEVIEILNNPKIQKTSARIKEISEDSIYVDKHYIENLFIPMLEQLRPYIELGEETIKAFNYTPVNYPYNYKFTMEQLELIQQIKEQKQ